MVKWERNYCTWPLMFYSFLSTLQFDVWNWSTNIMKNELIIIKA
jgi:hypothetical protein